MYASSLYRTHALPASPRKARSPAGPQSGIRFTRGLLIGSAASGTLWAGIIYAVSAAL